MHLTQMGSTEIRIVLGDITELAVDGIVNAANSELRGGGGVDGAIHRAGGPSILLECRQIAGGCPTGSAVATTAGQLNAQRVLHTVGPIWQGGDQGEPEQLASAYRSSLELAAELGLRSLAFPSISTGVYGYPTERAAPTAVKTILSYIEAHPKAFDRIIFCLFGSDDYELYLQTLAALHGLS